jgi:ATP-dependent protease HslVU (ClpYQ) peptidase subunit
MDNIIDDYDEYCERVNYRFVVKYVVPEIIKTLKNYNFLKMSDDYLDSLDSSFLFAYKDKLFLINYDCAVIEIEDYVAIGSGAQEAIGSLLSTEGEEPFSRIVKAIKASAASDIYVDYPIVVSDTQTTEFEVINEDTNENHPNKKK